MAHAVDACVHCGFCLAACPTYRVLGEEMDSPRGRIFIMKEALEGGLEIDAVTPFVDRCLGCMACVSACPSGVPYGELLMPFRARSEGLRRRAPSSRLVRTLVRETLPYPRRFRAAVALGRVGRRLRRLTPPPLRPLLDLLPAALPPAQPLPTLISAQGSRRARVALLAGCVQQVLAPQINAAAARVLARNGVEVVVPPEQGCCGSLALHSGDGETARRLARRNLAAFPTDVDAVITTAAGCGSGMREYALLFAGAEHEAQAAALAARTLDISAFLAQLGLLAPPPLPAPLVVAYHDACHLAHAQGVSAEPRRLLAAVGNLTVVEIPDELCCGSAGTYNLEQPAIADELGRRKAQAVLATGAAGVVTGNIGCMAQIATHLAAAGRPLPLWHTVELLDIAYRGANGSVVQ